VDRARAACRYRYKGETGRVRMGFIAEEMPAEVLSADRKGVDTYELLAHAIAALQAQQEQIDHLRGRLDALERTADTTARSR
jgi:hypothetical protein